VDRSLAEPFERLVVPSDEPFAESPAGVGSELVAGSGVESAGVRVAVPASPEPGDDSRRHPGADRVGSVDPYPDPDAYPEP
jgi:hypothetical protein